MKRHSSENIDMAAKWLRLALFIVVFWTLLAGILLVQLWPNIPRSNLLWYLFIGFGPALYILGEGFFGWLFSPSHGYAISSSKFSFRRILIALPIAIFWSAVCYWVSCFVSK